LKVLNTRSLLSGIVVTLLLSGLCFAQYGGSTTGGGSAAGNYGSGKTLGLGVGVAAAGAGVLYLTLRHRGSLTGCVEAGYDGLSLVDEKKHQIYSLMAGSTDLKPGERVQVRGKRSKDGAGAQIFEANRVVKNLGACSTRSAVNVSRSSSK
jgi:hypothetical protein